METILVVNGERDWQTFFPGFEVRSCRLQTSQWLYQDGILWMFDGAGTVRVDAVLWRLGAVKPHPNHRAVLELIRLAQIPCVNPASVLLRGYDRLAMLNELQAAGLPMLPMTVGIGEHVLNRIGPDLPAVVKVGNFHGGFGKARAVDLPSWNDIKDLLFITDEYATVEPYIEYVRDIRCLAVGEALWSMARRGESWKANTQTIHYELIPVPPILADYTQRAMRHFGADVLGIDFLELPDGSYVTLESNDIPGFAGFPDHVRVELARCLQKKMKQS